VPHLNNLKTYWYMKHTIEMVCQQSTSLKWTCHQLSLPNTGPG